MPGRSWKSDLEQWFDGLGCDALVLECNHDPELLANMHLPQEPGVAGRRMLSLFNEEKLRRVLARMLDENEFLGRHGIRSLSRYHLDHPFNFWVGHQEYTVKYLPAESNTG